jgi:hypothetical protein
MTNHDDGFRELSVFRRFADFSPEPIHLSTIYSRKPPEPDILCEMNNGPVAFELAELIDRDFAKRIYPGMEYKEQLENTYESLAALDKEKIAAVMNDALVFVDFDPDSSTNARRNSIPKIISYLPQIPATHIGYVALTPELRKVLKGIHIVRGGFQGPLFDINSAGFLADPSIEVIGKKFGKSYETANPIELLAYFELQPVLPENIWLPVLTQFVAERISTSPFRRVWVVDLSKRVVHLGFPVAA